MKDKIRETLAFEDLTTEEKEKRHILGRLYGPIADVINPTRNGRKYSEQLWENVFSNPIMQEKIKNGVCFGELGHPEDRTEIDMSKVAVCMPEAPKKDKDGHLIGYFDILDTPNGRILKTLCDYGSTLGISSRGTGDLYTDDDGEEAVDPETYDCECFDIVLVPAVESARLTFTEGLNKGKSMRQALTESLENASEDDRKVMKEALDNLNIKLDSNSEKSSDIESESLEQTNNETTEAIDDGNDELVKSLQEALSEKSELEERVNSLQKQLAVSDTKVNKLEEDLEKSKSTIIRLTSLARNSRELTKKISTLNEELKNKQQEIDNLSKEKQEVNETSSNELNESLASKEETIKSLNENLETLRTHEKELQDLNESLEKKLNDSSKLVEELNDKVTKSNKLVEGYKNLSNKAVSKYIELKAKNLGVTSEDIKDRLNKRYSFEDIDRVCESLMAYELRASQLPYNIDRKVKVKVNNATQVPTSRNEDDDVDETLMGVAGLI